MPKAKTILQDQKQLNALARNYVDARLMNVLMQSDGSLRANELLENAHIPGLDAMKMRALLLTAPERFFQQDRRWMPLFRKTDRQTPLLRFLERIVETVGEPVHVNDLARECATLYRRSSEVYETMLPRVASQSDTLFCARDGYVGLRKWLFDIRDIESVPYEWLIEGERRRAVEDALFYNFMDWEHHVEPYLQYAEPLNWTQPSAASEFVKKVGEPIDNRIIGFMGWYFTLDPDPHWVFPYDPLVLFETINESGLYQWGNDGKWYPKSDTAKWMEVALKLASEAVGDLPEEEVQPLEVSDEEVERIVTEMLKNKGITSATRMLQEIFEVPANSKSFQDDLYTLISALWRDGRVQWLGYDRFGRETDIPGYVQTVPPLLDFPELPEIINEESNEPFDIALAEDGYPKSLQREIKDPRAQDVMDEEPPTMTAHVPDTLRCVIKSQHRELGTLPMCQIPLGFFPDDPSIQSFTFIDEKGNHHEVWLNHETRLIYGLLDRFAELDVISGAIFELKKTNRPDTYQFEFHGEHDPLLYLTKTRYEELLKLQEEADELSTYHILVEALKKHQKGADFLTLHTEVNIVRRSKRELIASLLSAYPAFDLPKNSTVWHLEEKEVGKPINKKQRKHLLG